MATVNSSGTVTGVSAGTAVITATTSNGAKATCTVTVNDIKLGAYDYLVNQALKKNSLVTYGDYKGMYMCILTNYGTNKDWHYRMYYDPDNNKIILSGSYYSGGSIASSADCTLEITPDLAAPYYGEYKSESYGYYGYTDVGTIYLNPATFTRSTDLVFTTYQRIEGEGSPSYRESKQNNYEAFLIICLRGLNDNYLKDASYSVKDLGFTSFS